MSTTHQARDYQLALKDGVYENWRAGKRNVLAVLPTGGGKTFTFAMVIEEMGVPTCAAAHRGELVSQISTALAREGVRHRIIGSATTARECSAAHMEEVGRDFVSHRSPVAVASVDTLVNMPASDPWFSSVGLWVMDEAHHVLLENKWGRACSMFPNAFGLGVTATPSRADGKGLGRHADGLMDSLVVGPTQRELINRGYLTDYRVVCAPSDLDLTEVNITDSGDYSQRKLAAARRKSRLTGNVVETWWKHAAGTRTVVFDVDVESAAETAAAFRASGVRAEVVSAKTDPALRRRLVREFRQGLVQILVNVDLFGEGFDLPAIETVVMARPTASYGLYVQQFGRALRPMPGKRWAMIIDHVGNFGRHGPPDAPRGWTLDRRERRSGGLSQEGVIPSRACLNPVCSLYFPRYLRICPYCGHEHVPAERGTLEQVDGDLYELDPAVLQLLRGEIGKVDGLAHPPRNLDPLAVAGLHKRHAERQGAQAELRDQIALWIGWQNHGGLDDRAAMRKFYLTYGYDLATACALGRPDAEQLTARIVRELQQARVVRAS